MSRLADLLRTAVPLFERDRDRLIQWAKDVAASDTKLRAGAGFGLDTTGRTIPIEEHVGPDADVDVGGFDDGWIAVPGRSGGDCPAWDDAPIIALSHRDREIVLIDCLGCQTRYDIDALAGGEA